jgi:hypothetical protein
MGGRTDGKSRTRHLSILPHRPGTDLHHRVGALTPSGGSGASRRPLRREKPYLPDAAALSFEPAVSLTL